MHARVGASDCYVTFDAAGLSCSAVWRSVVAEEGGLLETQAHDTLYRLHLALRLRLPHVM